MKKFKWKWMGFMLAIMVVLTGNLIGISALATEGAGKFSVISQDDPPTGVLKGYTPEVQETKTGEHLEYWGGWVGVPFAHLVTDYTQTLCCRKTLRAMDGCKDLPVCGNR